MRKWAVPILLFFFVSTLGVEAATPKVLSVETFAIPKSIGKVGERYQGNSDRIVFQIQDVHANYSAQENISAIVDYLNDAFEVTSLALEGGWSETSLPLSWALENSREKQLLSRALMEDAHIGGPVHAALATRLPLNIVGIEDIQTYKENLELYLHHFNVLEEVEEKIQTINREIQNAKEKTYNTHLLKFDKALSRFREGKSAEKFLPSLVYQADRFQVSLEPFNQVRIFKEMMQTERRINKKKLKEEQERLVHAFKKSRLTYEEILRSGKVEKEKLQYYPQSKRYLKMLLLKDQIDHHRFFLEIDDVIVLIKEHLIQTDEEQEIADLFDQFVLVRSLLHLKAIPEDIENLEKNQAVIETQVAKWGLVEHFETAKDFYEHAKDRDEIFFDKIKNHPSLQGNIMLVTGGFHTNGISQRLRKAGISYVVITPEINTDDPNAEELYFERLQDRVPVIQTLSHEQNRYAFLDSNFPAAVDVMKRKNSIYAGRQRATRFELRGGNKSSVIKLKPVPDFTLQDFEAMSETKRQDFVEKLFEKTQAGTLPISIVIKTSVLQKLSKMKSGKLLWEEVIGSERANKIFVIHDINEYLEATIGIRARVIRVSGDYSIDDVIENKLKGEKNIAVIDAEYLKEQPNDNVLALPEHPMSFLLVRVMLESHFKTSLDEGLLDAFEKEVLAIYQTADLMSKYA